MSATQPDVVRHLPRTVPGERPSRRPSSQGGRGQQAPGGTLVSLLHGVGAWLRSLASGHALAGRLAEARATLVINGETLRFGSLREFEFALAGRSEPPMARAGELDRLTLFELRRMATEIRALEHRLSEILSASLERGRSLGGLMPQLDIRQFSTDHEWRAIFAALAAQRGPRLDRYRRVALARYMQYLRERQGVIQRLYVSRGNAEGRGAAAEPTPASAGPAAQQALHETAIFDFTQVQVDGVSADEFWLLPRGESIAVTLSGDSAVSVLLGRHVFKLVPGERSLLVTPNGVEHRLRPGRNTVGRSQACDIAIDPAHREISRKHLVIDRIDAHTVVLTDLSSHGTRVPAARVVGTRAATPRQEGAAGTGV